ncbi:MAG: tetratricopeptide repeat protein [Gammaproteobacteria bacterium]|nr:tetratricopeptide repeat protein [Gammaproteobacteria bacterium]
MEEYYNAHDEAQVVKTWLKKYALSIVLGLILGIALFYGIRHFMAKRVIASEQAATAYFMLLNSTGVPNNPQTTAIASDLVENYPKTPYATMAQLFLAQSAVNAQNYDLAESQLQWVLDHGKVDAFKQVARIRLARVLLAQNKINEAETVLKSVDDKTYTPLIEATRGDIFLAQKQYDKARQAYQSALKDAKSFPGLANSLQMKLSDPTLAQV